MALPSFINSKSARAPLNCSVTLLKSVVTYHQVAQFFLNPLLTFSEQTDGVPGPHMVSLQKSQYTHTVPVSSLGRSSTGVPDALRLHTNFNHFSIGRNTQELSSFSIYSRIRRRNYHTVSCSQRQRHLPPLTRILKSKSPLKIQALQGSSINSLAENTP